jgi:hypothetical protein
MKAKFTDEAHKLALAKLSGWSEVPAVMWPHASARRLMRSLWRAAAGGFDRGAPAELCAKICIRKPPPNPLVP